MKRNIQLFLILCMCSLALSACKNKEEKVDDNDTTEQVALDDVEVEDYTVLNYNELEVLAYEGDTDAMVMLGRMLEYGADDVKQSFTEAISWYQMASDSGNIDGTCALGYFYLTGTGVDKDLDKALELFDSAIEGGSANAYVGKARVLLEQLDIEQSVDEDSITNTANNDNSEADSEDDEAVIPEEEKNIYDLFYKAQISGDVDGAYYLGYAYENGIGIAVDYKKAFDYYSRAAKYNSTDLADQNAINKANVALGLLYVKGEGVDADSEQAITFFETASNNNYAKGSYYLGQIYENAVGVDRDYEKAMEYYLMAADLDYAPALNQIGYMYYNGYGVDVDFASAVYYQKLAALQGYAIAQVNLGFLYENGYGVERNLETALSYYEMAADSGYEGAMEAVVRVKAQINEEM
ncbi:tetratricopeptide repeat protein [Pseudobutyrivibrio ruminis]|uniref:tetratricopeptide repeat protein n=1 Tax=Pseudobutyrivibrio ruminis TaxID=46206 RepID=UPI00040C4362|nr:SEL1-like repeat protein [Pseudobutyrivibrio ruminis]